MLVLLLLVLLWFIFDGLFLFSDAAEVDGCCSCWLLFVLSFSSICNLMYKLFWESLCFEIKRNVSYVCSSDNILLFVDICCLPREETRFTFELQ